MSITSTTRIRRTVTAGTAALVAGWLALASTAGAQSLPVNAVPANYVIAPLVANCMQDYRLYLPEPPLVMPAEGWPVLIHFDLSGFGVSEDFPSLPGSDFLSMVLRSGIAVVTARSTLSKPIYDCDGTPVSEPGGGLFHPPGWISPDLGASAYDDPAYPMPEKDAALIIQHVRFHAGQPGHLLQDLDKHRIAVHGVSAGAISLMWTALGPDRRGVAPFAGLGGQYDMPTRPDFAVLRAGTVWWPIFDPLLAPNLSHFGEAGLAGTPADKLGDVDPTERTRASALAFDDVMRNDTLPTYLYYDAISHCEDYASSASGCAPFPFCFDGGGLEGLPKPQYGLHPAWNGYTWKTLYPGPTRLVVSLPEAQAQAHGVPFVDVTEANADDDITAWLRARFDEPWSAWTPIFRARPGNDPDAPAQPVGVPGTSGQPVLTGSGSLLPGTTVALTLTGARPLSTVQIVIGLDDVQPPFGHANEPHHAGILVPESDIVIDNLKTDVTGTLVVTGTWPIGQPAFTQLYYQAWITDHHADDNLAASNALLSTTP